MDDSGNPGAKSGSEFLPSSRKSWTAVIVPSSVASAVETGLTIFLDGVREQYGAEELHFTEIWSGTGIWKDISPGDRSEVFRWMGKMVHGFGLPVVHQTVSEITFDDHPDLKRSIVGDRSGDWSLDDIGQFGLLMLTSSVAGHLRKLAADAASDFTLPMPLYVDEGVLPAGLDRPLPNWRDAIEGPTAKFRRSTDVRGLQLADFAAFAITRSQWIISKRSAQPALSPADAVIMEAVGGMNVLNLPWYVGPPEELHSRNYDKWMGDDREAKGLPRHPSGQSAS
ncbi:DUF3800 domain-containing protein [Aureimonas jatrophae]|uniref:DUF3800 domain-containing protein n=1 Tax=Aureimonas jatrophae TaxID=1166073 RepID=UPI0017BBC0BE|nr:DUF3800 domain-containing protein [Aureimonas jatrophae]MBB3952630.1 hypothetical protein [Aureimonas jatrophae]